MDVTRVQSGRSVNRFERPDFIFTRTAMPKPVPTPELLMMFSRKKRKRAGRWSLRSCPHKTQSVKGLNWFHVENVFGFHFVSGIVRTCAYRKQYLTSSKVFMFSRTRRKHACINRSPHRHKHRHIHLIKSWFLISSQPLTTRSSENKQAHINREANVWVSWSFWFFFFFFFFSEVYSICKTNKIT